jgi:hypothetical protein
VAELIGLYLWAMTVATMRRVEGKSEDERIGAEGQAAVGRSTRNTSSLRHRLIGVRLASTADMGLSKRISRLLPNYCVGITHGTGRAT